MGFAIQAEAELQKSYFEPLVKKEQMEEKMRATREVKCRVVTCRTVREAGAPLGVGAARHAGRCVKLGLFVF